MTARITLTYQDYVALPDDGKRYEIHDGELSVTPAPTSLHQIVSARLFRVLDAHVLARSLGLVLYAPLDVILSDGPNETRSSSPTSSISITTASKRCTCVAWRARRRWRSKFFRPAPRPPTARGSVRSTPATVCRTSGSSIRMHATSKLTCFAPVSTSCRHAFPDRSRSICRHSPTSASCRRRCGRSRCHSARAAALRSRRRRGHSTRIAPLAGGGPMLECPR